MFILSKVLKSFITIVKVENPRESMKLIRMMKFASLLLLGSWQNIKQQGLT